jgi:hypothetical protein
MPIPLVGAALAALMPETFAGFIAWATTLVAAGKFTNLNVEEMRAAVFEGVVKSFAVYEFHLDPLDPFSDTSLAGAISEKIQVPLRSVRDRAIIEEDIMRFVSQKIGDRTGLYLSNPKDVNAVKADIMRFAGAKISEHAGIPLSDITNRETTLAELKEWGLTQAYTMMAGDAKLAVDMFLKAGVNVDVIVRNINAQIERKEGAEPLDAKALVMAMMHSSMAQQLGRIAARGALNTMKTKRQLQMQAASMRFRERNAGAPGGNMWYQRIDDFQRSPRKRGNQT